MAALATQYSRTFQTHLSPYGARATTRRQQVPVGQAVASFIECVNDMLDEFGRRADSLVTELESGGSLTLAQFEHEWDSVQMWLKANIRFVRALKVAAERAVRRTRMRAMAARSDPCDEALVDLILKLDRVCHRIDRMLLNASFEAAAGLHELQKFCQTLRHQILEN